MNEYQTFYIQKSSQSFSDTLVTYGLATVLQDLLDRQGDEHIITIIDKGSYYELSLSVVLLPKTIVDESYTLMPRPALATAKTQLPDNIRIEVYEEVREKVKAYFDTPQEEREHVALPPKVWDVYRALNPASITGYNSLMCNWYQARDDPETLFILFDLYTDLPNDFDVANQRWKALDKQHKWAIKTEATCQQLYNPDSGKGQNKTKADGLSIGNMKNFWLSEWLKAIGFYESASTKQLRGTKDRKTLVLAPRKFTFAEHQEVMNAFQEAMRYSESSIRFDIFAAIRYCKELLRHVIEPASRRMARFQSVNIKKHYVSGFHTAFYKNMGNSIATMNLSFIALPDWIDIQSAKDVPIYQAILDELEKVVRQFDESHSDDVTLLQHLRDFISGDDLKAFFRFSNAFAAFLIGKRERNQYAHPLTTDFIERIVMSIEKPLAPILESEGFQNIAYAIRQATVTAQYRKKQNDNKYDVRYGLGQDLARKARYPQDFIVALSDFLHKYNAENARVMETRPKPYRRSVQTSDIDQIVSLIDDYSSETIANLLIAYGYARVPRDTNFNEENTEQENK
ncbi:MAG: hypothetical protein Q9P01_05640 [Anaerolineae bacterium]|nr:hypothetical protein [Anaerolineae bacterium]MDQ7034319.1 hypothetical protein [Anaerolineae bacterium]